MAHQRTPYAYVRRLVLTDAFFDDEMAEIACRTSALEFISQLEVEFGDGISISDLNIERGEILVDARGRGTLQR